MTTQLVERLELLAERHVLAHLQPAGRDDRSHLEHRPLMDAWLARAEKQVEMLLTEHISNTLEDLRHRAAASRTP